MCGYSRVRGVRVGADASRVVEDVHTSDPVGDSGVSPLSPPEEVGDSSQKYILAAYHIHLLCESIRPAFPQA